MRHLLSLIAGVVAAPLAWAALAKGQAGAADTVASWAADDAFDTAELIVPAAYLAGAGILLGLVVSLRVSPLGPVVAALGYLALNVGLFVDPFAVQDAIPTKILGLSLPLHTPLRNGTLLAVGAVLLITVFSKQRWRQWPVTATGDAGTATAEESAEADSTTEPTATSATADPATETGTADDTTPAAAGGKVAGKKAGSTAGTPQPRHAAEDDASDNAADSSPSASPRQSD